MSTSDLSPRVIAVVGAGAVGGWLGARLAAAGHDVRMVGRPAFVEAVAAHGLRFVDASGELRARVRAQTTPAGLEEADLVLLTTKSRDTVPTAEALAPHLRAHAAVLSLQNGVDNAARAAAVLGRAVWAAAVYVGVEVDAPGVVRHTGRGDLLLGGAPTPPPGASDAGPTSTSHAASLRAFADALAATFTAAGVPTRVVDDVGRALWQKLVVNVAYNAISAITRRPYGVLLADPALRAWMLALADEALRVAEAAGVGLDVAAERAGLWRVGEAMPAQLSSTAQDLLRGRPTEIEALNGHVAQLGARLAVETPENARVTAIVRALEGRGA
jgi:2-dehydropantoate 2-reductase